MDLLRSYPCPWIDFTDILGPVPPPIRKRFWKVLSKDVYKVLKKNLFNGTCSLADSVLTKISIEIWLS